MILVKRSLDLVRTAANPHSWSITSSFPGCRCGTALSSPMVPNSPFQMQYAKYAPVNSSCNISGFSKYFPPDVEFTCAGNNDLPLHTRIRIRDFQKSLAAAPAMVAGWIANHQHISMLENISFGHNFYLLFSSI